MNSTYFKKVNTQFIQAQLPSNKKKLFRPNLPESVKCKQSASDLSPNLTRINSEPQRLVAKSLTKSSQFNQVPDKSYRDINNATNQMVTIRLENEQLNNELEENGGSVTISKLKEQLQNPEMTKEQLSLEVSQQFYKNKSFDCGKITLLSYFAETNEVQLENDPQNTTLQACLICFDKEPNAVNMQCGHGGICYECAIDIMQKNGECYLCRQEIEEVLELDLHKKTKNNLIKVIKSAKLETQLSSEQKEVSIEEQQESTN